MNGQSVVTVSTTVSVSFVVAGDGFDPRDDRLGADRKEFERRLHESKPPLGRDALAIVGGVAREEPLGERGHERSRICGKIPVD